MTRSARVRLLAAAFGLATSSGCAGRLVDADRSPHGNLHAELVGGPAVPRVSPPAPLVIMIEREGARAIDPVAGKQLWFYPRQVVGHPVGSARAVYLPLRGNRVAALDRRTGAVRWLAELPGEALSGLAVAEPVLLAAVLQAPADPTAKRRQQRNAAHARLVALSTEDAAVIWTRGSRDRWGAPVAQGRVFIAPLAGNVVALRTDSGRESARVSVHADLDRLVQSSDGTLMVGGGNRFVNLRASTGGIAPAPQEIEPGYGMLFADEGGMDRGFDDGARLELSLAFAETGEAPREGVLLSRRAVVSMRLSPSGRPLRARWVFHDRDDPREFVAMHPGEQRVTLVREDGSVVELSADNGEVLHTWAGVGEVRGALLLDLRDTPPDHGERPPSERARRAGLMGVLRDHDERLLPAQILAVELLWRSDDVRARRIVRAIAQRPARPDEQDASERLRQHAQALLGRSWGTAEPDELAQRLGRLSRRPSFLAERDVSVADLAAQTVKSGTPEMIGHIVAHLMHPATPARDLPALVDVLGTLGGTTAAEGLMTFVRAYHADPEIVSESVAVHQAVAQLAELVANGDPVADRARAVLDEAFADPFTDPALRVHIERLLAIAGPVAVVRSP